MPRSQRLVTGEYTFKICVLGMWGAGKTSLLKVFKTGQQIGNEVATIGCDTHFKTIEMDGNIVRLTLWDTAGQERFQSVCKNYLRNAHGILLVYSYDKAEQEIRESLKKWMDFVKESGLPGAPVIIVGNKIDLTEEQRFDFTTSMGISISRDLGLTFFETSAKDQCNVNEAFRALVAEILQQIRGKFLDYRAPKKQRSHQPKQLSKEPKKIQNDSCC